MPQDELTKAVKAWQKLRATKTKANAAAKDASKAESNAKHIVLELLETRGQDGVKIGGQMVSKYILPQARVSDREAFAQWAAEQDGEAYFEPEPRVREGEINQLVRKALDDGQPLPPGLSFWPEEKISMRKV